MDRDAALATCFANLKGPRDKRLIETAEALRFLKFQPDGGSNRAVGRLVGVSGEIVREFLALLDLPLSVQRLLRSGDLSLEQGRRLHQLALRRPSVVEEAAEAMVGMSVLDSRHLADFIARHSELPVGEAKRQLLDSKTVTRREFHVIAVLPEQQYELLRSTAHRRAIPVDGLVTEIVTSWLKDPANDV